MIIKIVDKNNPNGAVEAKGELIGAGFTVVYEGDADAIGVDAKRCGDGEQTYGPAYVIAGTKN